MSAKWMTNRMSRATNRSCTTAVLRDERALMNGQAGE